jgi:multiple sugar transport system substrate-binding protein
MRLKRMGVGLAVLVAGTLVAAACGSGSNSTSSSSVGYGKDQPKVTINFWYMPNGSEPDQYFRDEAASFEAAHPNISVQGTNVSWSDALNKLTAAVTSGVGPDVTQVGTTWVGTLSKAGGLHAFSQAEIDGMGGSGAYNSASWKTGEMSGSSQLTAAPWFIDTRAIYYRKDVLQKLGIDPNTAFKDWNSFDATLAKIKTSGGGVGALGMPGKKAFDVVHNVAPWVWGAGGDYLNKDGTKATMNSPATVDGVNELQTLAGKYVDPAVLQQDNNTVEAMFAQGKFAVMFDGSFLAQQLTVPASQQGYQGSVAETAGVGTEPFPSGPKANNVFFGGSNLGIMKSSKHEAAAYEWVRWLTGEKAQESYVNKVGLIPARTSAAKASVFTQNQNLQAFLNQLSRGRSYPTIAAWGQIESALVADFGKMYDGISQANGPLPKSQVQQLMEQANQDATAAIQQSS